MDNDSRHKNEKMYFNINSLYFSQKETPVLEEDPNRYDCKNVIKNMAYQSLDQNSDVDSIIANIYENITIVRDQDCLIGLHINQRSNNFVSFEKRFKEMIRSCYKIEFSMNCNNQFYLLSNSIYTREFVEYLVEKNLPDIVQDLGAIERIKMVIF